MINGDFKEEKYNEKELAVISPRGDATMISEE